MEMKITLSYLIEPNPSARPPTSRYRYESHSLRFDVKRSTESEQDFREHINQLLKEETDDEGQTHSSERMKNRNMLQGDNRNWLIRSNQRHKGSLHSDIWRGSAADLAREPLNQPPTAGHTGFAW
ncbi:MAG: hypothetical protein F4X84_01565 [Synechococcus sp. SB0662_bin_45]|nr:hypothetical protein [Synechococcus sp. SB0662_bin_45]